MWILPKQLHTLDSVQDTEALNLGLEESSKLCAQSLFVRSKPSPLRTWSQKWKRDSWSQFLYGRILKPSLGEAFVTEWTSLLEVIPASHLVQPVSDLEKTTLDTSGHGSQMELELCDPESASLRMSKDTSALDSERSSANWKALVTKRRGEYSARVKLAHLINASECLSWPTCAARDYKGESGSGRQERKGNPADTLPNAVAQQHGQADPASLSTNGSLPESWATPSTMDHINVVGKPEDRSSAANKGGCKNLREEVHQWATPQTRDHRSGDRERFQNPDRSKNLNDQMLVQNAKLNPRWVETLMGLPIGWTMPSCSSPLTIAPMNCDCSETELCQQQQNVPS